MKFKCLGIECTAHTFGASVVEEKGNILSEVRDMYTTEKGGIIPIDAAKHHKEVRDKIINQALKDAKLTIKGINLIAISKGPGLAPCLLSGMEIAKQLSKENNIPITGINHLCAHLEIGKLFTKAKDPVFVFVSGANTQIIAYEGKKYRVFGETLSIGLGNALDKFAREAGLGFPGGPKIEQLAKNGKYIKLPYTVKGMDVEFSGIITEAIKKLKQGNKIEDLCFSLQETFFAMMTEVTERAMAHCDKKEALLIGGVAANKKFIEMLGIMCKERKAKFYFVPIKYSGDNAAMIAWNGILNYKANKINEINTIDINPRWRIDELSPNWINHIHD